MMRAPLILCALLAGCPLVADLVTEADGGGSEPATGAWFLDVDVPDEVRGPVGAAVRMNVEADEGHASALWRTVGSVVVDGVATAVECDDYPLGNGWARTMADGSIRIEGLRYDVAGAAAVVAIDFRPDPWADDEDDGALTASAEPLSLHDLPIAPEWAREPLTLPLRDRTASLPALRDCLPEAP